MAEASILIVEDEPELRDVLSRILSREGHSVRQVASGEDALDVFQAGERVDLVLLDVGLPGISGFDVCEWLKGRTATRLIPVIILTGLGDSEHRIQGIEAGADDFVSKPFDRLELLARVRSLLRLKLYTDQLENAESVLFALARSIELRDPLTHGHCERLSVIGVALARKMGLGEDDQVTLRKAGALHDLGKITVPDAILLKAGPLTPAERLIMEQHPLTGDEICKPIRSFADVRPVIRHHHERMDGSGYPDGLVGEQIPITARVLQVVDVFDALISARSYKAALPIPEALQVLRAETEKGWWDPEVVSALEALEASGELDLSLEEARQATA